MSKPAKTESLLSTLEGILIEQEQQRDLLLRLIRQPRPVTVSSLRRPAKPWRGPPAKRCSLLIPWLRPSCANGSAPRATSRKERHEPCCSVLCKPHGRRPCDGHHDIGFL